MTFDTFESHQGFNYEKLRWRVADLRRQKEWTIEELAKQSGLSRLTIHYVENNKHKVSLDTLWKIAKAFGLTISELLEGM